MACFKVEGHPGDANHTSLFGGVRPKCQNPDWIDLGRSRDPGGQLGAGGAQVKNCQWCVAMNQGNTVRMLSLIHI
jgi:hypothetical protein